MLRKSVTDYDHEPCFAIYGIETKDLEWVTIPHESKEKVLSRDHLEVQAENDAILEVGDEVFLRLDPKSKSFQVQKL